MTTISGDGDCEVKLRIGARERLTSGDNWIYGLIAYPEVPARQGQVTRESQAEAFLPLRPSLRSHAPSL